MVVAQAPNHPILLDRWSDTRAFLRFFGMLCAIPTVQRIVCLLEGGIIHCWVHLNDDNEAGQDAIFEALRRFQSAEGVPAGGTELHVIFADEDVSALPHDAEIIFVRE